MRRDVWATRSAACVASTTGMNIAMRKHGPSNFWRSRSPPSSIRRRPTSCRSRKPPEGNVRAPNKPVKPVARENLIALLNRMKRYYDKTAADCGALAEKMQTASDDNVGHVERELLSAIRLGSLAQKNLQAAVDKCVQELHKAQTASARSKRHPG